MQFMKMNIQTISNNIFFLKTCYFFSFDIKNTDFLYATAHTAIANEIEYIFSHSVTHKAALYVYIK
jgi:hypothetical protein